MHFSIGVLLTINSNENEKVFFFLPFLIADYVLTRDYTPTLLYIYNELPKVPLNHESVESKERCSKWSPKEKRTNYLKFDRGSRRNLKIIENAGVLKL